MTSLAASSFKNDFAGEEFRTYRCNPTQKLLRITLVGLSEMGPLPTELRGSFDFVGRQFVERCKTGNASLNWKAVRAGDTYQIAFHDLSAFGGFCLKFK